MGEQIREIEFQMVSEERRVSCSKCLRGFDIKVFWMEHKGAICHFIFPVKDNQYICEDCS